LTVPIAARAASGAPQDLPIEIANSIEDATDSLSSQLEMLFEARNQALQLVLQERLAERVLELETALTHRDRRISDLEKQISGSEAPTETEGQEGNDSEETAINGLESFGDNETALEDGDAIETVDADATPVDEYELDDGDETIPYTVCEREYRAEQEAFSESLIADLPNLAGELQSVIRNANEELADEVFRVLNTRDADLGLVVQDLIETQIVDLENEAKAKDLWIESVRQGISDLQSLISTSPDNPSVRKTYHSETSEEGLFEPLGARFESESAAPGKGVASEPASLDTVSASTEEEDEDSDTTLPEYSDEYDEYTEDGTESLPIGPARDENDSTDNNESEPSTEIDVAPSEEQSSIPVETPSSQGPKIDIGRVETTTPEIQSSEDELTADETTQEVTPSTVEGTSADTANESYDPASSTADDDYESFDEYSDDVSEEDDSDDYGDVNTP